MVPGARALAFASRWFDPKTIQCVFEPLVADWQREWRDASGVRQWSVAVRGLAAFMCAAVMSSPRVLRQATPSPVSRRIVTRICRFTLLATVLLTLPYVWSVDPAGPLLLFLIPSGLALAFPFAMVGAVDAIRCDQALPSHVERATVLKLAIASVVFMVIVGGFVTPAANQAFRLASFERSLRAQGMEDARVARIMSHSQAVPQRRARELSTYELMTDHGFSDGARFLPEYVNQELNNRASLALLPVLLMWLRWRLLDMPRRRWAPLPPAVVAISAVVGFQLLRTYDSVVEAGLGLSSGAGAWSPLVVLTMLLCVDAWWRASGGAAQQWRASRQGPVS